MKKNYFKIILVVLALSTGFISCKTVQPTVSGDGYTNLADDPCSEYKSTKNFVRAIGLGESMDKQVAERLARAAALEKLGSQFKVAIQDVLNSGFVSRKENNIELLTRKAEALTQTLVDQTIAGYRIVCEKYQAKGSTYR